jgi:adenine-specific DNA-methyltransferase
MANPSLFEQTVIHDTFVPTHEIVLHTGDTAEFVRTLPDGTARLVITSPPYNIGKQYETKTAIQDYLDKQDAVIDGFIRVLADNGSLCWQVGNYVENSEVFPLDIFYYHLFKKRGLKLRNRIIWHFAHGLHASVRFSGRYETLLWFTKGDDYVFNLDTVRIPSKYPGKTHFKGPNRGKPSGNPLGKNPSDVWRIVAEDWERELWDIPNVKANHPEKTIHPCQFPIELVERCVLALTNEGDWVFDPYCGVGSSLLAAINRNRRAMGCEKEHEYVAIARDRIAAYQSGELKIRPLGKPVHQPTGREKVSQVPEEWKESS